MNSDELGPGTVALITGASSGIGLAATLALAKRGCRVIITARRADRLNALANDIGSNAYPVVLDVRDRSAVDGLIASLPNEFRAIDVLINNAGHDVGGRRKLHAGDADEWADVIETNVQALIRMTRAILPGMIERRRGDIVNIGSTSGIRPSAEIATYGASKAAVHMFSDNLRSELAGSGVRVIELLPGPTETEFQATRFKGDDDKVAAFNARIGVLLRAEDVARSIMFALDQPRHVTMAQIVITPSTLA